MISSDLKMKLLSPNLFLLICGLLLIQKCLAGAGRNYSCSNCSGNFEYVKLRRLDEIKSSILEKLQLQSVPNITREDFENLPPLEEVMSRLGYDMDRMMADQPAFSPGQNSYMEVDDFHLKPENAVIFPDTEITQKHMDISNFIVPENLFQFRIAPSLLSRDLQSAVFHFYLSCSVLQDLKSFEAVVEKVVLESGEFTLKKGGAVMVRGHSCQYNEGRWLQIDVKKDIQSWFTSAGEENFGLKLRIYNHHGQEVNERLHIHGKHRPFLKVFVNEGGKIRKRRQTSKDCDDKGSDCCRASFMIDFEDFGWDWIIAPRRYDAFYCRGECTFNLKNRDHVLVQSGNSKIINPCCAPRTLSSMSMIYVNQDKNIVHGILPSMVVSSCACQS